MVRKILGHLPVLRLETESNPDNCLVLALKRKPDLILVNLNINAGEPFDLMTQLNAHPMTTKIPVFALSATELPHEAENARHAGFKHCLTKPVKTHEFFQIISNELEDIHLRQRLHS